MFSVTPRQVMDDDITYGYEANSSVSVPIKTWDWFFAQSNPWNRTSASTIGYTMKYLVTYYVMFKEPILQAAAD